MIESLEKDILSEIIQEQNKLSMSGIQLSDIYPKDELGSSEIDSIFNDILCREIHNSHKNW